MKLIDKMPLTNFDFLRNGNLVNQNFPSAKLNLCSVNDFSALNNFQEGDFKMTKNWFRG